ncbi:hypothetical protein IW252_000277 [Zhihengliuella flava]|uniref:Uncharacterized protein n=1 Tax=Zhihengliuella flava TaxID=1285193 RepID=A0A931GDZ8_9MICC|nr:hypothetical protein [Zhihengliuella flava]
MWVAYDHDVDRLEFGARSPGHVRNAVDWWFIQSSQEPKIHALEVADRARVQVLRVRDIF